MAGVERLAQRSIGCVHRLHGGWQHPEVRHLAFLLIPAALSVHLDAPPSTLPTELPLAASGPRGSAGDDASSDSAAKEN